MIALLDGTIAEKSGDRVVVSACGVGYEVLVSSTTLVRLPPVGKQVRLYTRLHVRDDAMILFGFAGVDERSLFDLLVTVSGVGPKLALAFLSAMSPDALRRAVSSDDLAALSSVSGVGKKMAGRVVVELKDRIGPADGVVSGPLSEVREALLALGLSAEEAREAVAALGTNGDRPVQEMLREALRGVGR